MATCNKCGTKNPDEAKFCMNCGNGLDLKHAFHIEYKLLRTMEDNPGDLISVDIGSDGDLLACGGWEKIKICDLKSERNTWLKHKGYIYRLNFSKDARILAARVEDGYKLWDINEGEELQNIKIIGGGVQFTPNGQKIVSIENGKIILQEILDGKKVQEISANCHSGFALSPNGSFLACSSGYNTIDVWELRSGKKHYTHHFNKWKHSDWDEKKFSLREVVFSWDNNFLASSWLKEHSGDNYAITLVDLRKGEEITAPSGFNDYLRGDMIAFSRDNHYLVSVHSKIIYWETPSSKYYDSGYLSNFNYLKHYDGTKMIFRPDGKLLFVNTITASNDNQYHDTELVTLWKIHLAS